MKVAIIVQRYGAEVIGGSESLASQYAHFLQDDCTVDVLTTCALDHITWRNHYPAGESRDGPVTVRRFKVDCERGPYWTRLSGMIQGTMNIHEFAGSPDLKRKHAARLATWPRALQEETIRWQGPYSTTLFDYLSEHARDYDVFLFCAYLFPTTYFGMQRVPRERVLVCPTLHDEPLAYLPILRQVFQLPRFLIFLSEAEQALAQRLHGFRGESDVIGMAISNKGAGSLDAIKVPDTFFALYAGRIEEFKGTSNLIAHFLAFKQRHPSDLKLVLIGKEVTPIPPHPDIVYLGFVSEADKAALMRQAQVFIHPSPFESFSIVLLESLAAGTPVMVNAQSDVLVEHSRKSRAGLAYANSEEFAHALWRLTTDEKLRREMAACGVQYVQESFTADVVREKLGHAVRQAAWLPRRAHAASQKKAAQPCPF